jgi:hypothetical protein
MMQMKRALRAALWLLAAMPLVGPGPALAGGGFAPEDDVIQPPGRTYQAVAVDLDGDGIRELVRVIGVPEPSQAVAVDIWAEREHTWVPLGGPVLLRRQPDPGEATAYDRSLVDSSGRLRVATPDGTRLLVLRSGSSERVVVATSLTVNRSCCLSLLGIELSAGAPVLVPLAERLPAADSALALDADGDGSDELLTRDAPIRSRELRAQRLDDTLLRRLRLYRVGGRSVTELAVGAPPIRTETPFVLGDSDGVRGQEAGMIDPAGSGILARVSWDGSGPLTVERTQLFEPRDPRLEVTGAVALPGAMLVASNGSYTHVAHWLAGSPPRWTGALGSGGQLLGVLGGGDQLRVVLRDPGTGGLRLLDAEMHGEEPPAGGDPGQVGWLAEYAGPLAGGVQSRPSIIVDGQLLAAGGTGLAMRPIASLAATYPIGLAGRNGDWLLLLRAWETAGRERTGGRLRSLLELGAGSLSIAPAAEVLGPQPSVAAGEWLTFEDSAAIPSAGETLTLAVAAGGYAARLRVPPGSLLFPRGADEREALQADASGDLTLRFPASRGGPPPQLAVVTPAGRSYQARWRIGRVIGAAPPINAQGSTAFLVGGAHIRGTSAPGVLLSVDGRRVPVGADGSFSSLVDAGLWPKSVAVSATDPLGQRSRLTVTVVGYLDYLKLPWLPIVTLSLLAMAALAAWRQGPTSTLRGDALVEVEAVAADSVLMDGRLPDASRPRDHGPPGGGGST